jgi:hypothetical protein
MTYTTERSLEENYGGHWGEHPTYGVDDWKMAVENDETRLSYWKWVSERLNDEAD